MERTGKGTNKEGGKEKEKESKKEGKRDKIYKEKENGHGKERSGEESIK